MDHTSPSGLPHYPHYQGRQQREGVRNSDVRLVNFYVFPTFLNTSINPFALAVGHRGNNDIVCAPYVAVMYVVDYDRVLVHKNVCRA